ncbi:54S ribosomal protein L8, mitochondrial [Didymosphaeria variabile]|uniref:Large ribosomal subunit protein bL17m n=1 Tax=Didymosphaeria variabile TaxID=1932322 RepID=A0A9W8XSN1_9PLEO|nr:54S ribosomal protein L8, mitochondrial [Didymosphaeria variabile]KAJ4357926.1 54S ribosomal protein L8, mitochondrial [Didymosphaeria variabile]
MAGGHMKYRHLSRSSSHREALLRNLVTSLFKQESITTTWHKAKEAQRLAEKLITLGKKNTEATRRRAHQIFFEPTELVPKLFGPIRERYLERPGGYTRVLRIEPTKEDQAESAILELVDGPKDMRFAMTAKTLSNLPESMRMNELTARNVKKVTQFRKEGVEHLRDMVERMREGKKKKWDDRTLLGPKRVYLLEERNKRDMHFPEAINDGELPNPVKLLHGGVLQRGTKIWNVRNIVERNKNKAKEVARSREEKAQSKQRKISEVLQLD